jgi:methionyl-tRNA formyltransferase
MRLAFAGTPEFAATILDGLLASEHEVGVPAKASLMPRCG